MPLTRRIAVAMVTIKRKATNAHAVKAKRDDDGNGKAHTTTWLLYDYIS